MSSREQYGFDGLRILNTILDSKSNSYCKHQTEKNACVFVSEGTEGTENLVRARSSYCQRRRYYTINTPTHFSEMLSFVTGLASLGLFCLLTGTSLKNEIKMKKYS